MLWLKRSCENLSGFDSPQLTGMVVSLDGTTLSVIETDGTMPSRGEGDRTRPTGEDGSMDFGAMFGEGFDPGSMEGFNPGSMGGFMPGGMGEFDPNNMEGFDPENFDGSFPEGGERPQWGGDGELPEDFTMPEGFTPGEGGFMPGGNGTFDPESMGIDGETKTVDITNAHISVENNGTKESGTTDNLAPGAMVTITLNGKGEATYILVSSMGGRFGGRGQSQG